MWKVREDARVRRIFATAWDVDAASLCTGFDGLGVREPGEKGLVLDWHVDQGPMHPPGRSCLQGLLCLTDVDETTGGTAFVVGSHVHHPDLCTRVATDEDWVEGEWEFMDVPKSDILPKAVSKRAQPNICGEHDRVGLADGASCRASDGSFNASHRGLPEHDATRSDTRRRHLQASRILLVLRRALAVSMSIVAKRRPPSLVGSRQ